MIEMCDSKWPFAMTRGGLIQIEKAALLPIGSTLPVTRCRNFGCREYGTCPIKSGLTDRGNMLFDAFLTVQGIDGGAAFRLGDRVMGAKNSLQELFRGRIYARRAVATTRRFVQQPE